MFGGLGFSFVLVFKVVVTSATASRHSLPSLVWTSLFCWRWSMWVFILSIWNYFINWLKRFVNRASCLYSYVHGWLGETLKKVKVESSGESPNVAMWALFGFGRLATVSSTQTPPHQTCNKLSSKTFTWCWWSNTGLKHCWCVFLDISIPFCSLLCCNGVTFLFPGPLNSTFIPHHKPRVVMATFYKSLQPNQSPNFSIQWDLIYFLKTNVIFRYSRDLTTCVTTILVNMWHYYPFACNNELHFGWIYFISLY